MTLTTRENVRDKQLQILCDEKKLHTHLGISADELCYQVQKIKLSSPNSSPFDPEEFPKLNAAVIGPWFSEILDVAGVEGSAVDYKDSDPLWHVLKFNLGDGLRNVRIDDCSKIIKEFGYNALSVRQGLYLAMLGFKPDFDGLDTIGLSFAATILRFPRLAVLYHFANGKKSLGDHWPSYREPFLQMPFGKIASS